MKRTVMALVAAAGLVAPLTAFVPQAAHADFDGCVLRDISAAGSTPAAHTYSWTYDCTKAPVNTLWYGRKVQLRASYDTQTKRADEMLTASSGKSETSWTCPADPWVTAPVPVCSSLAESVNADRFTFQMYPDWGLTAPYSATYEADSDRQAVDAALRGALQSARSSAILKAPTSSSIGNIVLPSNPATRPAGTNALPIAPDLQTRILDSSGPHEPTITPSDASAVPVALGQVEDLTIQVRNAGIGEADNVELQLYVTPHLSLQSIVSVSGGFTCAVNTPQPSVLSCTGGSIAGGDWNAATNIVVRVKAVATTNETFIAATADPHNTIAEGNEDNNKDVRPLIVLETIPH